MQNHSHSTIFVCGPTYLDRTVKLSGALPPGCGVVDTSLQMDGIDLTHRDIYRRLLCYLQAKDVDPQEIPPVEHSYVTPGGTGLSYADAFSKLGYKTSLVSVLGDQNSPATRSIVNYLKEGRVDTEHVQYRDGQTVDSTTMIVDTAGNKLVGSFRRVTPQFDPHHTLKKLVIGESDHLVITSFNAFLVKAILLQLRTKKQPGQLFCLALNSSLASHLDHLRSELDLIDYLTMSEDEYKKLSVGLEELTRLIKIVSITGGRSGYKIYFNNACRYYPPFPGPIDYPNDTNGAGEAFGSAFFSSLIRDRGELTWEKLAESGKLASLYASQHIMRPCGELFPRINANELSSKINTLQ